jgi:hypothetical protein
MTLEALVARIVKTVQSIVLFDFSLFIDGGPFTKLFAHPAAAGTPESFTICIADQPLS